MLDISSVTKSDSSSSSSHKLCKSKSSLPALTFCSGSTEATAVEVATDDDSAADSSLEVSNKPFRLNITQKQKLNATNIDLKKSQYQTFSAAPEYAIGQYNIAADTRKNNLPYDGLRTIVKYVNENYFGGHPKKYLALIFRDMPKLTHFNQRKKDQKGKL